MGCHGRKARVWGSQPGVWWSASLPSPPALPSASAVPSGHTGRGLAGRPLPFTGRSPGQDNHLINPKSTPVWTRDRRMHQIRTARAWFPRVWAYLSLLARFLSSGDVSGACAVASPGWFYFFFHLLITEKRELLLCLKGRGGKKTPLTAYALWQH